jgi:hypothetical protein
LVLVLLSDLSVLEIVSLLELFGTITFVIVTITVLRPSTTVFDLTDIFRRQLLVVFPFWNDIEDPLNNHDRTGTHIIIRDSVREISDQVRNGTKVTKSYRYRSLLASKYSYYSRQQELYRIGTGI